MNCLPSVFQSIKITGKQDQKKINEKKQLPSGSPLQPVYQQTSEPSWSRQQVNSAQRWKTNCCFKSACWTSPLLSGLFLNQIRFLIWASSVHSSLEHLHLPTRKPYYLLRAWNSVTSANLEPSFTSSSRLLFSMYLTVIPQFINIFIQFRHRIWIRTILTTFN